MKNLRTGIKMKIRRAKEPIPVTCSGVCMFEKDFRYKHESYRLGEEVQKIENGYTQLNLFLNLNENNNIVHNGFTLDLVGKRQRGKYVFIPWGSEYVVLEDGRGISNKLIVFSGWLSYMIWKLLK
jgi:hypothetical protein